MCIAYTFREWGLALRVTAPQRLHLCPDCPSPAVLGSPHRKKSEDAYVQGNSAGASSNLRLPGLSNILACGETWELAGLGCLDSPESLVISKIGSPNFSPLGRLEGILPGQMGWVGLLCAVPDSPWEWVGILGHRILSCLDEGQVLPVLEQPPSWVSWSYFSSLPGSRVFPLLLSFIWAWGLPCPRSGDHQVIWLSRERCWVLGQDSFEV